VLRPRYGDVTDRRVALDYARSVLGRPFDTVFNSDDDSAIYCAELVRNALARMPHPIDVPTRTVLGREIVLPDVLRKVPEVETVWSTGGTFAGNMASHWPQAAAGIACAAAAAAAAGPLAGMAGFVLGTAGATLVGDVADPTLRRYLVHWWRDR